MAKFKNKNTGVILTTDNKFVVEQLKKNPDYKEVKGTGKPADNKQEQPEAGAEEGSEEGEGAAE